MRLCDKITSDDKSEPLFFLFSISSAFTNGGTLTISSVFRISSAYIVGSVTSVPLPLAARLPLAELLLLAVPLTTQQKILLNTY